MNGVVAAVVVAAGRGFRAGGDGPKQYREVGGEPVIRASLKGLSGHPGIAMVQPVIHPDDCDLFRAAEQEDRQVRTLCMTLAYAGCRLSEALTLTVDRVDLAAGVERVERRGRHVDAAASRHLDVEQNEIRFEPAGQLHGLNAGLRLTGDFKIRMRGQHLA